jgi:arylsulfatase A-like enzyme
LPDKNVTIAEALKAAGYTTIHLGKWHLGADPCPQGFDINIGGDHSGSPYGGYFVPFKRGSMQKYNSEYPKGTHRADIFADQACKFLQSHKDKPFFMYMAYYSVHSVLQPVPEFITKYKGVKGISPTYASMIEKMDQSIGKIMNELDRLGLKENTLVLFTSDNGGVFNYSTQRPHRAGKGSYFEGGIRVPLCVRWPAKIKANTMCAVPVSGIDIYPTFLAATGAPTPKGKLLDGVSLMPLLTQNGAIPPRAIYWHFPIYLQSYGIFPGEFHDTFFRTRPGSAMVYGKWKLHEYFEDGNLELYDLSQDAGERHNLANQLPEKTRELHAMMQNWRNSIKAPIPTKLNPAYKSRPKKSTKSKGFR